MEATIASYDAAPSAAALAGSATIRVALTFTSHILSLAGPGFGRLSGYRRDAGGKVKV
jgi:hypothetical protein